MTAFRYYVAASLDGRIALPDDSIDWLMEFGMDEFADSYTRLMDATGALVMGAHTYEFVLAQGEPWGYGDRPTWVFTNRELASIEGADLRFVAGAVSTWLPAIRQSAGAGDVRLVGGGGVAGDFAKADALDELVVTVMPVLLGSGKPVFDAEALARRLTLTDTRVYPSGAVEITYRTTPALVT